jgi:mannose-6-phosphate isomerase-like protein (cupin superfamily)
MKRATSDQENEIPDAVVIEVPPDLLDVLDQMPQEVKIKTCLRLEIVDLLERYPSPAIRSVLEDEYFWREKLKYDFPDLVEFVGTGLPSWIFALKGSLDEAQDYRPMGPWRRYYYTARYFMRLVYKTLLSLASKWAPVCNVLVEGMPPPTFRLERCQMVPGKTRLVSLFEYKVAPLNPTRTIGSGKRRILTINAFCAKYLINDVGLAHIFQDTFEWSDPWYYGTRRPETVNPIRTLMMQVAWYEKLTDSAIFNSSLVNFVKEKQLRKFLGWILYLNPAFDPYDRSVPKSDTFPYYALKKTVFSNIWVRDSDAPFPVGPAAPTIAIATEYTRTRSMFILWTAMETSRMSPDELRMTFYDEAFLRWRSSYTGLTRDEKGRMLIGKPLSADLGKDSLPIGCNGQPLTLERAEVVHLFDQVASNKKDLHLPLIQSQDMQVMAMAVEREVPMETHSDMSQLLVVIEGTALLTVKATQTERGEDMRCLPVSHHMQAGDAYLIPRRTPHQIQNTSEDGQILRMFTVYSPPNHKE